MSKSNNAQRLEIVLCEDCSRDILFSSVGHKFKIQTVEETENCEICGGEDNEDN